MMVADRLLGVASWLGSSMGKLNAVAELFEGHRQLVASGQLNLGDRQLIEIYCQHTLQISAQISNFWVLDALCSAAVT